MSPTTVARRWVPTFHLVVNVPADLVKDRQMLRGVGTRPEVTTAEDPAAVG